MSGITILSTVAKFRHDSPDLPFLSFSGVVNIGRLKVSDWIYSNIIASDYLLSSNRLAVPNKTLPSCPLVLRNTLHGTDWTYTSDITVTDATAGDIARSGSNGYGKGGYYNTTLTAAKCSVEAATAAGSGSEDTFISLQNNSGVVHDPFNAGFIHGIQFGKNGLLSILEVGAVPVVNGLHKYLPGDRCLIELTDGIVRYYHFTSGGKMTLLRATRSKLTTAPRATAGLRKTGTSLLSILVFNNEEGSTNIETVGVIENFQDWKNDFNVMSNADSITMANNEQQFTYPNPKRRLRSLSASLGRRDKEERWAYEDFFGWHGMEKDFLFVDYAKTDAAGNPTEFWAKFASPFGDRSLNQCLSAHQAVITESYRSDYVPK